MLNTISSRLRWPLRWWLVTSPRNTLPRVFCSSRPEPPAYFNPFYQPAQKRLLLFAAVTLSRITLSSRILHLLCNYFDYGLLFITFVSLLFPSSTYTRITLYTSVVCDEKLILKQLNWKLIHAPSYELWHTIAHSFLCFLIRAAAYSD